mgnify:CR=1 FL=1
MSRGIFITGTDTGVGKTVVTAGLVRLAADCGRRVVGLKPVASGAVHTPFGLRNEDTKSYWEEAIRASLRRHPKRTITGCGTQRSST